MTADNIRGVLSAIIVFGFGAVVIAWMIWPQASQNNVLVALSATLGSGYLLVLNYWFTKSTPA